MFQKLTQVKNSFPEWNITIVALFYHDLVYNISRKDNEEKSAWRAAEVLQSMGVEPEKIHLCQEMIRATKAHLPHSAKAINYFTDADLAILGAPHVVYEEYTKNIRKEFGLYPDLLYKPGRKKVVQHFLNMSRIFKTDFFFQELEAQARANLAGELQRYS